MQHITCTVKNSHKRRETVTILQKVSGYFNPGEMAALMGPSGSGESITCLAERIISIWVVFIYLFYLIIS